MSSPENIRQRVAAKAMIANAAGEILILREARTYQEGTNHGRYHFPGGRITPGEPFFEGLRREVREETGLEIEVGQPIFVGEWFPVIKGEMNHIVAMFLACTAVQGDITLSDEHDDYQWVAPARMKAFDVMDPEPSAVQAWQKYCGG